MNKIVKNITISIFSILLFLILSYVFRIGLRYLPDFYIWGEFKPIFNIYNVSISVVDIIYLTYGIIVTTHGFVNLFLITEENHKSQNMKTRKPESLITTGYYSKARHPMYGTFIIIWLGLFISTRSLWGILIIIIMSVVQYINCYYEEKNELIKIFGNTYKEYMKNVTNRLFLPVYKKYILIASISILGIIII